MRKIISVLLFLAIAISNYGHDSKNYEHSDFFKNMQADDKAAILMIHFGTTHDDTREVTIEALNNMIKKEFPDVEFREAYSSRIIIKRLGDKGIKKHNPLDALKQLHSEGYTHILIQSSAIINGVEMESIYRNVEAITPLFKDIRVGNPLLYTPEDYEQVIDGLTGVYDNKKAYIWVGHGTYDATTAQYTMVDYMLKAKGHTNCFVGTIEGYPTFEDMHIQLEASGLKDVVLIPFMFVAGEHAKNDMAGDWKEELEERGFNVSLDMKGLGENPEIQKIYLSHLKFIISHRKIGIMEKKSIYEQTGEKLK